MSEVKEGLLYTQDDEWLDVNGSEATIGITDYAQDSLSDIVYLELPDAGESFAQGDVFGVVESVKAAADLFAPVAGDVTAVNEELIDEPEAINTAPYDGWMIKLTIADASQLDGLMDADGYKAYLAERE